MKKHFISVVSVVASSICASFYRGDGLKNPIHFFFTLIFLIGCSSSLDEELMENDDAGARRARPNVSKVMLVDAVTNLDIGELINNTTFDVGLVNIRAESNAASVVFQLTGAETYKQVENVKPFALKGDDSGDYSEWIPKAGDYTLTIIPYSNSGGTGIAGSSKTIRFRVGEILPQKDSINLTPEPGIYFAGNFAPPVSVTEQKIIGWAELDKVVSQGFAHNGTRAHVFEEIRNDNGKNVLYAEVIDDDPGKSGTTRFQWSMFLKQRLDVIHFSYRIFLSPDIAELAKHPDAIQWFTLIELWNERDPNLTASSPYNGSCRWNLSLNKDKGIDSPLYWTFDGEFMQPLEIAHNDIFTKQKNKTSPLYLGQWVTLDYYQQKGENGNIKITITPDGGKTDVLFDFRGMVMYPNRPELSPAFGGQAVNVFKLYTSDQILDWMRGRGKKVYAKYDELKWYRN